MRSVDNGGWGWVMGGWRGWGGGWGGGGGRVEGRAAKYELLFVVR